MLKKYKIYIINIAIALAVGALSGLTIMGNFNIFDKLVQPPLSPPPMAFPIVWTVLYTLMGISAGTVHETNGEIPFIYWLQLAVNFFWPIIFFNMQAFMFAFIWLILLGVLIAIMIYEFYKINKKAAYLQIPYLIWTVFAGYLTLSIWFLNSR